MNRKELMQFLRGTPDEDFMQVSADALTIQTKEIERLTESVSRRIVIAADLLRRNGELESEIERLQARNEVLERVLGASKSAIGRWYPIYGKEWDDHDELEQAIAAAQED